MTVVEEWQEVPMYVSSHECTVCGSIHSRERDVVQHLNGKEDAKHTGLEEPLEKHVDVITKQIDSLLFESLYVANKHAKKFSNRSKQAYRRGEKGRAKELSNKKKGLYGLKETILKRIQHASEEVAIHEIDGNEFYCLYFVDETDEQWSFHTPKMGFPLDSEIDIEEEKLEDFTADSTVENSDKSLREALVFFDEEHQVNANRFIPSTTPVIVRPYRSVDAIWGYL